MKTYAILELLTDEEVERMLAAEYYLNEDRYNQLTGIAPSGRHTCPLGVALEPSLDWEAQKGIFRGSPVERVIADILEDRSEGASTGALFDLAAEFTGDNDTGRITPEQLPEIVRASRNV